MPSYNKKNDTKKPVKRIKSKITVVIIWTVIICILIAGITFTYNVVMYNKYKKYDEYIEKMDIYGYSRMYDNKSPKSSEKVTKSEAIKMIVSTALNVYSIEGIAPLNNPKYDNEIWVNYANAMELLPESIDEKNQNDRISYIDVLSILSKVKVNMLELNLDIEGKPTFSDIDRYKNEQQTVLKDAVWNKIIDNNTSNLNGNRKIAKGELNELLIKFSEKYRTMTLNSDDKFVINDEKLPYNFDDYPYVLANVNKKIYETKFYTEDIGKSKIPIEIYADEKENMASMSSIILQYFDAILNVDYATIDINDFRWKVNQVSMYEFGDDQIQDYINYVKENKIKLIGNAKIQMPIVYFDGSKYRARTIVEFNVEQSNKLENVLFSDNLTGNTYKYDLGSNLKIIDVPFEKDNETGNVYICMGSINKNIAGDVGILK